MDAVISSAPAVQLTTTVNGSGGGWPLGTADKTLPVGRHFVFVPDAEEHGTEKLVCLANRHGIAMEARLLGHHLRGLAERV